MAIPTFQKVVMVVALILLVICLILIGIALYRHRFKEKYPPVVGTCPDYWEDVSKPKDRGVTCKNTLGLGSNQGASGCPGKGGTQEFSSIGYWHGKSGICNKAKWAKSCGLTWDGVTNSTASCDKHHHHKSDDSWF